MIQDITQCNFKRTSNFRFSLFRRTVRNRICYARSRSCRYRRKRSKYTKAIFAKNIHNLNKLEFYQDDVRNLSREKYGEFDIVICSGILYHLDSLDVFPFLEKVYEVCKNS